jgi:aspartate-semialdehyde dehydrogenase|tara:strand:- start:107 stop:1117 length:1011 start_codon:yes stop_codon:yes gene_type:complete
MNKARKIAIVGATGMVGQSFLKLLENDYFLGSEVSLLASSNSAGKDINFRGVDHKVQDLSQYDFFDTDFALFSAGSTVASTYAPIAVNQGCLVIDNSSCFRYEEDIPLVVPEVNSHILNDFNTPGIIANPNCSTIQMLVALKPLHDEFVIERIDVTTFQAVSGTGKLATEELINQIDAYKGSMKPNSFIYAKPIANNVLPHCDEFEENRYTKEENKLVKETKKILDPDIKVAATCVRVPVLNGHSESVHIQTKKPIAEDLALKLLKEAPGLSIRYGESEDDYPTAFTDGAGNGLVHVGRIRKDLWEENRLNLWVVADNLLKGAALNSIQIATLLFD